jgi:hypothetical protein
MYYGLFHPRGSSLGPVIEAWGDLETVEGGASAATAADKVSSTNLQGVIP